MTATPRHSLAFHWLFLLSFVTTLLLLSDDYILRWLGGAGRAELELGYVSALWATNLCFWLCGRRWFVNACLILFSFMQLIQLAKIDYSGVPLHPYDIANLFKNTSDVAAVFWHELPRRWDVILAWLVPYGTCFFLFNRLMPHYSKWSHRLWSVIPVMLVVYALVSRPLEALDDSNRMIEFMPGITRSSLHNSINAFSYYIVSMAFDSHMDVDRPDYEPYTVTRAPVTDLPENIIVLIPDSLRFDQLGIAGYRRQTTPELARLKAAGKLDIAEGIASSVATGSSLPLMINAVREPGNLRALQRKRANLFRRAKEAGYRTFWVSSQESKLLSNLGVKYIDHILTEEDYPLALVEHGEMALIPVLEKLPLGDKNLIVIKNRSVHAPYDEAYSHADNPGRYKRWPTSGVDNDTRLSNAYDNAIFYLDEFLAKTVEWANGLPGDTLWVMTSDHGQELSKSGIWGHNVLTPRVAQVPMVLYQHRDSAEDHPWQLPHEDYVSHYQLTRWLLRRMGFVLHNPNRHPDQFIQLGFNIFSDTPYRRIIKTPDGLVFCKRRFVSSYRPGPGCADGAAIHDFYDNLFEHI